MSYRWSEGTTLKFASQYVEHECLWNIKSPHYKNKQMKQSAYQDLQKTMNFTGFGEAEIKLKIKNIKNSLTERNKNHFQRYYEFTEDEVKVLEDCDRESFYQRCLPLSTAFAALTYAAVRTGCLARNRHFGAVPKVLLAVLLGHAAGRLSYLRSCEEKLRLDLPTDSHLSSVMQKHHKTREERNAPPKEPAKP